jgi:tetratricopeptide (TPR) repeat protein
MTRVEYDASRELHDRAIEIAESLHDQRALAMGLNARGALRAYAGDRSGLDDLEASLGMLVELGSAEVTQAGLELGWARLVWNGPVDAAPILAKALDDGARTRNPLFEMFARSMEIDRLSDSGSWDELLEAADHVLEWAETHQSLQHSSLVAPHKARVLALRGHISRARTAMTGMLEQAQRLLDAQLVVPAFTAAALIEYLDGNTDRARTLAQEIRPAQVDATAPIAEISRILTACNATGHAQTLIDHITAGPPRLLNHAASGRALLTEADSHYARAAELYEDAAARWRTYGHPYELAHALAGRARCLISLKQADAAKAPADEAAAIFGELRVQRSPIANGYVSG